MLIYNGNVRYKAVFGVNKKFIETLIETRICIWPPFSWHGGAFVKGKKIKKELILILWYPSFSSISLFWGIKLIYNEVYHLKRVYHIFPHVFFFLIMYILWWYFVKISFSSKKTACKERKFSPVDVWYF